MAGIGFKNLNKNLFENEDVFHNILTYLNYLNELELPDPKKEDSKN